MSKLILKTRCTKGFLVLYEDKVGVELKAGYFDRSEAINLEDVVGVDIKVKSPSIAGFGGAATVIINTKGDKSIVAELVKPKDAKAIREAING